MKARMNRAKRTAIRMASEYSRTVLFFFRLTDSDWEKTLNAASDPADYP